MENDDISSKNNLNPQDQLNYKNKAKNLEFVKNNSNIKIPYFKEIIFDDFENIEEILGKFSKQIIIRSNSSKEDTDETSSAGKFLSIGPIDKNLPALEVSSVSSFELLLLIIICLENSSKISSIFSKSSVIISLKYGIFMFELFFTNSKFLALFL